MLFGSMCSGIEAASVAWEPLGWRAAFVAEIEAFPSAVLAHHWPDVPNLGDFTRIEIERYPIELLVAGTPCQAFSVAGARRSLGDERGNLTLQFVKLVHASRTLRWVVWENVPGVLSTKDNAFGCFLGGLVGADVPLRNPTGKRWPDAGMVAGPLGRAAWRVLDAQYFRLAQRRRRVFVVFSPRTAGGDPAAVLFERKGMRGDSPPVRKTGEETSVCPTLRAGGNRTGGDRPPGTDVDTADSLIAFDTTQITSAANYSNPRPGDPCHPLSAAAHPPAVAFAIQERAVCENPDAGPDGMGIKEELAYTLEARQVPQAVGGALAGVRRLTTVECARLQGFPDHHTRIPWKGKPPELCPDGPQYRSYGNSMAVKVMRWIGEQIQAQEQARMAA